MLDNLTVCPPPSDVQSGPVGLDLKVWSSYVSVSNLVGTSCREREREREREIETHTHQKERRDGVNFAEWPTAQPVAGPWATWPNIILVECSFPPGM